MRDISPFPDERQYLLDNETDEARRQAEIAYERFLDYFPTAEDARLHMGDVRLNAYQTHWLLSRAAEVHDSPENVLRAMMLQALEYAMDDDPRPLPQKCLACNGSGQWRNILRDTTSKCGACAGTGKKRNVAPPLPPRRLPSVAENETQDAGIPW